MLAWLQKICCCFPQPQPISHGDHQSAVSNAATPDGEQKDREHQPLLRNLRSYSEKSPRDVDGCYRFEGSEEGGGEFIDIEKSNLQNKDCFLNLKITKVMFNLHSVLKGKDRQGRPHDYVVW